jgi:protein-tyrosine phosphatase
MKKILFVCLGNICRSPLAEGILLALKNKYGLNIEVDSAGTSAYHLGELPDRRTVAHAKKKGFDLSALRARQFKVSDFDTFDHIFVMDSSNYAYVLSLSADETQQKKVSLLLQFTGNKKLLEVPDPFYGGDESFEHVFDLIYHACDNLCLHHFKW